MGRARQAAVMVVALLALTTVVVGVAAERSNPIPTAENCVVEGYRVDESSETANDFEPDELARYENLTPEQQGVVDRAIANEGEAVPLRSDAERAAVRGIRADAVLYEGTVYRDGTRIDCPLITGLPVWLDPYIGPFALLYVLFSGPLLPVVVLGVAGGVAYAVGEWARY